MVGGFNSFFQEDPFYTRLAYSTVTAPSSSYDNSVIVGGDPSRTEIEPLGVGEDWAASRHRSGSGGTVRDAISYRKASRRARMTTARDGAGTAPIPRTRSPLAKGSRVPV